MDALQVQVLLSRVSDWFHSGFRWVSWFRPGLETTFWSVEVFVGKSVINGTFGGRLSWKQKLTLMGLPGRKDGLIGRIKAFQTCFRPKNGQRRIVQNNQCYFLGFQTGFRLLSEGFEIGFQLEWKIGFRLCSNWISTGNRFVNWISWWQKSLVNGKVTKHLPKS